MYEKEIHSRNDNIKISLISLRYKYTECKVQITRLKDTICYHTLKNEISIKNYTNYMPHILSVCLWPYLSSMQ